MSSDSFCFYSQVTIAYFGRYKITVKKQTKSFVMGPDAKVVKYISDCFYKFHDNIPRLVQNIATATGAYSVEVRDIRDDNGAIYYPNKR